MSDTNNDWLIFKGDGKQHDRIKKELPPAPPWRRLKNEGTQGENKNTYIVNDEEIIHSINAAIYLRRPILVTGNPGTGKSSLAYAIVHELKLEKVIKWSITTETSLLEGLYRYDAIARLHDVSMAQTAQPQPPDHKNQQEPSKQKLLDISKYLRLGPLGSAFASDDDAPSVLLIDELDKSNFDLPNNLLNLFEDNEFEIPELSRLNQKEHNISLYQSDKTVLVENGIITCSNFPIVIMTSNGEREFSPAFLRRCIQIELSPPDEKKLYQIIETHFETIPEENQTKIKELIKEFNDRREQSLLATDQLMNAVYLVLKAKDPFIEKEELLDTLWHSLK